MSGWPLAVLVGVAVGLTLVLVTDTTGTIASGAALGLVLAALLLEAHSRGRKP